MTRYRPNRYTILISGTGREPIVVSFHPAIAFLILILGAGLLLSTLIAVFSYVRQNSQLAQRNSQLTQEAGNILERLEALETKIGALKDHRRTLRESSGIDLDSEAQADSLSIGLRAKPEVMLSAARDKIPSLLQLLQHKTLPISEQTALREISRPSGMPIAHTARITSLFGLRSGTSGWGYEMHQGIDFVAAYGSPVQATAPGTVEKAGWDQSFGNRIVVDHGYGYRTLYAHLDQLMVTEGMAVDRHQILGYLGNTGRSREPHLHYGVYRNGYVVDPKDYLN
ncbi:MAG: M23 family metallopeptidase [Drouetiella hepatica Uher 2000/2452]|jgi:murein DD-endopeptidase MepM/ murein hydrolase activator NlpD|uniref:M23 family metallopeptidase n=1 Tax=Drouetiella hepatica Uher 2000/2452 TaxID=904376 RepID=A0A951QG88_9CYAN|nr:M23 family metallopeptidase [Drouetiella hepatica Uher 2000/2452]